MYDNMYEVVCERNKDEALGEEMIRRVATRFGGSEVGHTFSAWNRIWKVRVPGMNAEAEIVQNEVG